MKLRLALTVLLGALVSTLALAQKKEETPRDLSGCAGPSFSLVKVVAPSVDFVQLRSTRRPDQQLEKAGTACRTAKNAAQCKEKLAKATSSDGWGDGGNGRAASSNYLVITRGDEVKVIKDLAEFAALVGPIDSAAKAGAIAFISQEIAPACSNSVRKVEGGFEVFVQSDSCFGPSKSVLKIDTKGAVNIVSSQSEPGTCVG